MIESNLQELDQLLERLCENMLDEPAADRLVELIEASPDCLRRYLDTVELHVALWSLGGATRRVSQRLPVVDRIQHGGNGRFAVEDAESSTATTSGLPAIILDSSPTTYSSIFSSSLSLGGFLFSYTAAALLVGIVLLIASTWRIHVDRGQAIRNLGEQSAQFMTPTKQHGVVGHITGLADCRGRQWSVVSDQWLEIPNLKSEIVNHQFSLGDRFTLAAGVIEITYDTGAKVILEGPCTYEIESACGGYLAVGKLTAKVEKGAGTRGQEVGKTLVKLDMQDPRSPGPWPLTPAPLFAVRTPTAIVTDLGTEFGVEVEESGTTRSHVYQGKVELRENSQRVTGREALSILHAGESARVERGRNSRVVVVRELEQPDRFVRRIGRGERTANHKSEIINHKSIAGATGSASAQAYAKYVLSLKPVVYYRMERPKTEKDRLVVFDSAPGGHHGVFCSQDTSVMPYAAGQFGDAILLRGPGPDTNDAVFVPDCPKLKGDRLTVVAWFLATARPHIATIITNRCSHKSIGQFCLNSTLPGKNIVAAVMQRDGQPVWCQEEVKKSLPLNCWQHVAMVVDDRAMYLYQNGRQVASSSCDGILPNVRLSGLGIGGLACSESSTYRITKDQSFAGTVYWQGRIDEVAIFHKALSPETVERLYLGGADVVKGGGAMNEP